MVGERQDVIPPLKGVRGILTDFFLKIIDKIPNLL
jgi:hypothetical protein